MQNNDIDMLNSVLNEKQLQGERLKLKEMNSS